MPISRREFIGLSALAAAGLALKPLPPEDTPPALELGRVTIPYLRVRQRPSPRGRHAGWLRQDDIVEIVDRRSGEPEAGGRTRLWCEVPGGYAESGHLQPVRYLTNPVETEFGENGFIGEVSVPFVDARRRPAQRSPVAYRLYYGSAFWVRGLAGDADELDWYRLFDDRLGIFYYVPAPTIRRVPLREQEPISPEVDGKRIVVNLRQQRLAAYEGTREVFGTLISSGRLYLAAEGAPARSWTPTGIFHVERKRPSRHMGNGEYAGSDYELPGVPWVSYFHWQGYAFHGAWWHNDFGRPRSAGCINMRPAEARWLYRWCQPAALPHQEQTVGEGTRVEIVEA